LAPHAAYNLIVQVRKPNNAANQKKEKCDLGLHRVVLFNASKRVARHPCKKHSKVKKYATHGIFDDVLVFGI
jgi:hypothetical protein